MGGWKGAPGRPGDRSATRRTRLLRAAAGPGHAWQPGLRPATAAGPATSPLARLHPPAPSPRQVITSEIDEYIDASFKVVPGVGNFGDRYFTG